MLLKHERRREDGVSQTITGYRQAGEVGERRLNAVAGIDVYDNVGLLQFTPSLDLSPRRPNASWMNKPSRRAALMNRSCAAQAVRPHSSSPMTKSSARSTVSVSVFAPRIFCAFLSFAWSRIRCLSLRRPVVSLMRLQAPG